MKVKQERNLRRFRGYVRPVPGVEGQRVMIRYLLVLGITGMVGVATCLAQLEAEIPDPLSWNQCVNLALQHNQQLKQAETQLEQAEGAKLEFRSGALPQASLTAITFPPLVLVDVRQVIFDQRVFLAWEASRLAESVSRLNYELRLNEAIMALRLAYLQMAFIQEQEQLLLELQQFLETRQLNARSMFEAGNMRKAELEQVEVRLSLIQNSLIILSDQKLEAQTNLLTIMGVGRVMGRVEAGFDPIPEQNIDRSRIVDMGLTGMPEVRVLDKLAEASDYQARIARADRYPNVYFFARGELSPGVDQILGREGRAEDSATQAVGAAGAVGGALAGGGTGSSGDTTTDPTTDTTGLGDIDNTQVGTDDDDEFEKSRALIGMQLRWDAYDGGLSEGKALQREADRDETLAMSVRLKQAIPGQVEEASNGVETAREMLRTSRDIPSFQDSLHMAQDEYEGGRGGQNETLAFALDSFRVHSRMLEEQYRASIGLTILRRISGQLLAFSQDSAN